MVIKDKTVVEAQRRRNEEALKLLLAHLPEGVREAEDLPIEDAVGRVLASEVTATMDEPPYSKATANGFVVLPWGTALASPKRPITFEVTGDMPTPSKPAELPTGKALRVKNGDYMSIRRFLEGNYAVLSESDEVREREGHISVTRFIERHEHILVQGSIWKNGNILLEKGHRIRTRDLFLLASQAILKVQVAKQPVIGIFSTGDEILSPAEPYRIGCKYDCNAYGLAGMIRDAGGRPLFCGIMRDQLNPFVKKLKETLEEKRDGERVDMVVISGGTLVRGEKFTIDLMRTTGITGQGNSEEIAEALKWAVLAADEIQPNVIGILKGKPVICLAGQPYQAVRGFRIFAWPVIARLLGEKKTERKEEGIEP